MNQCFLLIIFIKKFMICYKKTINYVIIISGKNRKVKKPTYRNLTFKKFFTIEKHGELKDGIFTRA